MTLPTKEELDALDMMPIYNQFRPIPERDYLLAPAGVEHYRLLKWVGGNIGGVINEVGVYMGLGTACLASRETPLASRKENVVIGWDIDYQYLHWMHRPWDVTLKQTQHADSFSPTIAHSDIILIDAWHNGKLESDIYHFLTGFGYKGILIYDDIYYNDAMKSFWNNINHPGKIDATNIGHSTGTGIIDFSI